MLQTIRRNPAHGLLVFVLALAPLHALAEPMALPASIQEQVDRGFRDTPMLPGGRWHVHDPDRPQAQVVSPGQRPGAAPADATVLFDGADLSAFTRADGKPADWVIADGAASPPPRASYAEWSNLKSKEAFGDVQLHLEFRTPFPRATPDGQMRGNSGVILMGLYEIQILDSEANHTYADGQASAIYGQMPPLVNASRPAGEWQSYDIVFEAPRFEPSGKLLRPAFVTVLHNGVLTQNHQQIMGATAWRALPEYKAHAEALPIMLQDHGCAVAFRNIWVRRL